MSDLSTGGSVEVIRGTPASDAVKGLTPKLNWILDRFESRATADALGFIDDILSLQRCFVEKGEQATIRDPELIEAIITNTARLAREVGAYYFGWEASNGALRYYTGLKHFMLSGYINGCAMRLRRGHGLRLDERIVAKNDFDIAAANAQAPALREGLPLHLLPKGNLHRPRRPGGVPHERDRAPRRGAAAKEGGRSFPLRRPQRHAQTRLRRRAEDHDAPPLLT